MNNGIELYTRLRQETAQFLGLDPNQMTAAQVTRLDRVTTMRLLADDLQTRAVRGESIDVVKFNEVMRELEVLFGGNPEAPPPTRFGVDHKARLKALIEKTLMAGDVDDEAERLRVAAREDAIQVLAALPVEATQAAPPPAEHTSQPSNVSYLPSRTPDGRPPPHYLRDGQPREAWRDGGTFDVPSWPLPQR